jgi:formylglycine-generating enzyme required for sulfatase activity
MEVEAFLIDKYEVTNAQYMEFVKATQHSMPEYIKENTGEIPKERENCPVTDVSWEDATAYCEWCGKRLPTEAEWEKAASWDPRLKRKLKYSWGNEEDTDPKHPWPTLRCGGAGNRGCAEASGGIRSPRAKRGRSC